MRNYDANVEKRRRSILSLLHEHEILTVKEISRKFNVSEVTVRRDLDTLSERNLVERTHGAACLNHKLIRDMPFFSEKRESNMEEKDRVAKKAAERLSSGDVVFVNSGTTVLCLPKHITVPDVKIVTNNPCMATAEGNQNINLFITGGERYPQTQSLVGDIAFETLSRIRATKCIISVNGISYEYGITSAFYMETAINFTMLKQCNGEKIVVADSSKIGKTFSFITSGISMIDTLITNPTADPEELQKIANAGVNIVYSD